MNIRDAINTSKFSSATLASYWPVMLKVEYNHDLQQWDRDLWNDGDSVKSTFEYATLDELISALDEPDATSLDWIPIGEDGETIEADATADPYPDIDLRDPRGPEIYLGDVVL